MRMQNKNEAQQNSKNAHLENLKKIKESRRKEFSIVRAKPKKNQNERFLIICEGKNTEPSYFN